MACQQKTKMFTPLELGNGMQPRDSIKAPKNEQEREMKIHRATTASGLLQILQFPST